MSKSAPESGFFVSKPHTRPRISIVIPFTSGGVIFARNGAPSRKYGPMREISDCRFVIDD